MKRISDAINICLRKKTYDISAKDILFDKAKIDKLIQFDDGYKFLRGERNSSVYWEEQKKKVIAMVSQLGCPTFFLTLSAAETRWVPLLKSLLTAKNKKEATIDDIKNLSNNERLDLIKNDPVTCSRYFDMRLRALFDILKKDYVFEKHYIVDFYKRSEFQDRGSPHIHCLLWIRDAPKYIKSDPESIKLCTEFIDKFISCKSYNLDLNDELLNLQKHKHSFTCRKYSKSEKKNEC